MAVLHSRSLHTWKRTPVPAPHAGGGPAVALLSVGGPAVSARATGACAAGRAATGRVTTDLAVGAAGK